MGKLIYDGEEVAVFDDRVLAHLQVAMGAKLRRRESFFLSWTIDMDHGSGRTTIWVDSHVSIRFVYRGTTPPSINRHWIEQLVQDAGSAHGMQMAPEPV